MTPYWFDENYYLTIKVNESNLFGSHFENANALKIFLAQMGITPYQHFVAYGAKENINPNIYFNQTEYLEAKARQMTDTAGKAVTAADVAKIFADVGISAAQHYADWGWKENLNPSNNFDTSQYLSAKQAQINAQPGIDAAGKPYAAYTILDTIQALAVNHIDPVGHFLRFGFMEQLSASQVPLAEQVALDPARPTPPTLSSDGQTITITFPSPLLANSIELADFSVFAGNETYAIKSAAKGSTDYTLVLTLEAKLPQDQANVQINYNPYGGLSSVLACERGHVAPFSMNAVNGSALYTILQTLSADSQTLFVSTLPNVTALSSFNIDMSTTTGVVSIPTGGLGIISPPLLENGALVNNLDASKVNANISLNITARVNGGQITTGQGADTVTLGGGADQLNYANYTSSRLDNLDNVKNFVLGVDKVNFTGSSMPVFAKNILNLAGVVSEATINSLLATETTAKGKAFLIKDGTNYLLLINDQIDRYEANKDFLLRLENFTYTPDVPLSNILGELGSSSNPTPRGQSLIKDGKTVQILFGSPIIANSAELQDFSITINGVTQAIDKVNINKDSPNVLELALKDPQAYTTANIQVSYNPNGGSKSQLACESGLVNSFNGLLVQNQSAHYYINERLQGTTQPYTLTVTADTNPNITDPSIFNIDMSATNGVISVPKDQLGLLSSPRLLDGAMVNHLDASGVNKNISLHITARLQGGEITSGQGSDVITLGSGVDHIIYSAYANSQLGINMDTLVNFEWGQDKIKFIKVPITDGTILNLSGIVTEASINAALSNKPNRANTAFLLMDGESYILVINDENPLFEANKDFTLRLEDLQNLPADPGMWGTDFFI